MKAHAMERFNDRWGAARWPFGLMLLLVFGAAVAYRGGFDFEVFLDEYWFWRQTVWFVDRWPPGLDELRNYPEPMTPLSFLIWGGVEVVTGAGIAGARVVTLILGVVIFAMIGWGRAQPPSVGLRAGIGLVVFPYTLALCIHVYTDVPAAVFIVGGFWLFAKRRPWLSGLAFALAIATRQYSVVFPAALAAAELAPVLFPASLLRALGAEPDGRLRPDDPRVRRALPVVLATFSLLGWIAFYGGLGPQSGLEDWPRHNFTLTSLEPAYALYFLTCIGAYFVLPEIVLFRRGQWLLEALASRLSWALLVVLGALFAWLFPFDADMAMGPINRSALLLLPADRLGWLSDALRLGLYAGLGALACLRFARFDLVAWLVLASACMMLASFEAWEKYNFAILATLWFLRSLASLDRPFELYGAATHDWRSRDEAAGSSVREAHS